MKDDRIAYKKIAASMLLEAFLQTPAYKEYKKSRNRTKVRRSSIERKPEWQRALHSSKEDGSNVVGLSFVMSSEAVTPRKVRIKVFGVGGAGGSAINRMIEAGLKSVEFIAVNTDYQDLEHSLAPIKIPIGQKLTRGLGSGGNPERGKQAAIEDASLLAEHLQGADLVFIAAGMGGGTGTGAAPVLARLAAEAGALVVAVVTKPFGMEGKQRGLNANRGLAQLDEAAATLIVIPNDNLLQHLPKGVKLREAFRAADDILRQGVQGITDLITRPGDINLDFEDAKTVLSSGGLAVMGIGSGKGKIRSIQAVASAINNSLGEKAYIQSARTILINFTADQSLGLDEVYEATEYVRQKIHPEANILWGTLCESSLGDELRVTIVASSFDAQAMKVLKMPAFAAQETKVLKRTAVAAVAGMASGAPPTETAVFGYVPSVDNEPPAASLGFIRQVRMQGEGADLSQTDANLLGADSSGRDYEMMQTPTFLRLRKKQ